MKNKTTYFLLLALSFLFIGQLNAQQDYFSRHLKKGISYYNNNPPEYVNALKEFDLAKNYISPNDQQKADTINYWNNKIHGINS